MLNNRINLSKIEKNVKYIDFLRIQIKSFKRFFNITNINKKKEGLYKIFQNYFPLLNKNKRFKLEFLKYYLEPPKNTVYECLENDLTYSINIYVKFKILYLDEYNYWQEIIKKFYLCTCPYITNNGSFIFNGAERVVIFQLNRSPGIYFGAYYDYSGIKLYYARVIPIYGSWLEFLIDNNNFIYVYIDKKKKINLISFLRAIGYKTNEEIIEILGLYKKIKIKKKYINNIIGLKNVNNILDKNNNILLKANTILNNDDIELLINNKIKFIYVWKKYKNNYLNFINNIFNKDKNKNYYESIINFYKLFKKYYPPNIKIAKKFINKLFFNKKKYNLGKVGRYKLNKKLNINIKNTYLTKIDYKKIFKYLINLLNHKNIVDDIDNLSNRQVKTVGDQLYNI
ncbi:MAG: DNA-directed RNA polymerase subunit beta, partial [Candidatus Shikimatogenerans sp. JK-2022]|nr:DNA-directed RNA polymerase subunit beta [Candidatus Shikimatogenerans bostrichidophilus]